MTQQEYELVIGKLVILQMYVVGSHQSAIQELIEDLKTDYLEKEREHKL